MRGLRFGLLFLCGIAAAGPASAQYNSASASRSVPTARTLNRFGLERAWWNYATLNAAREQLRHLVADEDIVVVQSTGGIVTAFDAETGKRVWAVQVGRHDAPSYPATTNEGLVLITSTGHLYALNKRTGNLEWKVQVPSPPSTSPVADGRRVYVGCLDGSVYAFNLQRIRDLYAERLLPAWSFQAVDWRFQTGAAISTPPLPIEGDQVVCFASLDRSLYCVTKNEREVRFQFETDAPVSAPLAYHEGKLYLASEDFDLYCINILNGNPFWRFVSGTPITTQPYIIGDDLFLLPETGGLFCLAVDSGDQRWWRPNMTELIGASLGRLYASDEQGNLVLLARDSGAVLGAMPLRPFPVRFHNDRTDRLFLASEAGLVISLREIGQEFPLYYRFPERRPILPEFAPENPEPQPEAAEETT